MKTLFVRIGQDRTRHLDAGDTQQDPSPTMSAGGDDSPRTALCGKTRSLNFEAEERSPCVRLLPPRRFSLDTNLLMSAMAEPTSLVVSAQDLEKLRFAELRRNIKGYHEGLSQAAAAMGAAHAAGLTGEPIAIATRRYDHFRLLIEEYDWRKKQQHARREASASASAMDGSGCETPSSPISCADLDTPRSGTTSDVAETTVTRTTSMTSSQKPRRFWSIAHLNDAIQPLDETTQDDATLLAQLDT